MSAAKLASFSDKELDEQYSAFQILISDSPNPTLIVCEKTHTVVAANRIAAKNNSGVNPAGKQLERIFFNQKLNDKLQPVFFQGKWFNISQSKFFFKNNQYVKITLKEVVGAPCKETIAAIQNLIASLLHQFRSPLTAMQGYLDILLSDEITYRQEKYLLNVEKGSDCLIDLLNELEDYLTANITTIGMEDICLMDLFTEILAEYPHHLQERIEINSARNLLIKACRKKTKKILHLLIDNALEYSENDNEPISVSFNSKASVQITNQGSPIKKRIVDNLYMPFVTSRADKMGNGLSFAQILA